MRAKQFTRDTCLLNDRPITYDRLRRDYKCTLCGERLVVRWNEHYLENWGIECVQCGGHDFTHEAEMPQQQDRAQRVLNSVPAGVRAKYQESIRRKYHAST